jgi:surface antigen
VLPGTSGGYPWNSSNCYVDSNAWSYGGVDGNGTDGLGYGCRQCVSYVAWRVYKETGYAPVNWGNAYDWPSSAAGAGFKVSSVPRAHSAGVITSGGSPGHIVWVESVNEGNGTMIVSQYNYFNAGGPGWGNYSKMQVPIGTYQSYIYF